MQRDEVKRIIHNHSSSNTYLDLANCSIHAIPDELYILPTIEHLYLEGNHLQELPNDFFENLPNLKWLDLRNNDLTCLPSSIGKHRNLKNVLLEKNQITHLPLELGNVQTITGLSLRGNPLEMPPPSIVERGVQAVLSYLLEKLNNVNNIPDQEVLGEMSYGNEFEFIPLNNEYDDELKIPSPQSGDDEFQRDIILHGPTPIPARFHQPLSRRKHKDMIWRDGLTKANPKVNPLNFANDANESRSIETARRKEWLSLMQQRKNDSIVLDEWREEAKRLQENLLPKTRTDTIHTLPPYGIELPLPEGRSVTKEEQRIHTDSVEGRVERVDPKGVMPKERVDSEVQARIRQHTSQLRYRRKKDMDGNLLQPVMLCAWSVV